jgi:hypothetical protein
MTQPTLSPWPQGVRSVAGLAGRSPAATSADPMGFDPRPPACKALRDVRGRSRDTDGVQFGRSEETVAVRTNPRWSTTVWLPSWLPRSGGTPGSIEAVRGRELPAQAGA